MHDMRHATGGADSRPVVIVGLFVSLCGCKAQAGVIYRCTAGTAAAADVSRMGEQGVGSVRASWAALVSQPLHQDDFSSAGAGRLVVGVAVFEEAARWSSWRNSTVKVLDAVLRDAGNRRKRQPTLDEAPLFCLLPMPCRLGRQNVLLPGVAGRAGPTSSHVSSSQATFAQVLKKTQSARARATAADFLGVGVPGKPCSAAVIAANMPQEAQ
ncbi:hypothetical protein ARSEF4850_004244 [Beauveria asiatica]